MESLGQYLKTQRELRHVTLTDISGETKIGANWLEAIEADKWDMFPCRTFARGFVKAYAKSLGLEVEEVIVRYDDIVKKEDEKKIEVKSPKGLLLRRYWYLFAAVILAVIVVVLALLL